MNSKTIRELAPFLVIAVAISAGGSLLWLNPLHERSELHHQAVVSARGKVLQFESVAGRVPEIESELQKNRERLKHVEDVCATAKDPAEFHQRLNDLANRFNVTIDRIGVQEGSLSKELAAGAPEGTKAHVARYDIGLYGRYAEVCAILAAIEHECGPTRIVNWRLTPIEVGTESMLRATLTAHQVGVVVQAPASIAAAGGEAQP